MRHTNLKEPNRVDLEKNNCSAEFKSKVVPEGLSGPYTLNELAEKFKKAPATLSGWHQLFQEHAAEILKRDPSSQKRLLEEKEQEIASKSLASTDCIGRISANPKDLLVKRQCELAKVSRCLPQMEGRTEKPAAWKIP